MPANQLVRPTIMKYPRHFLVYRVRSLRREIISQNLQDAQRAIVTVQMVATSGRTNLARYRLFAQYQRRRSLRRILMGHPIPQTGLPFMILK